MTMPETLPLFPVPESDAESHGEPPEGEGRAVTPETPGERLDRELSVFLPGFQVVRVAVLAEEYAAAMVEEHARRPGSGRRR